MSITIEEDCKNRTHFLMHYYGIDNGDVLYREMLSASKSSQHEELESLRAQLAEKDAMLGKCAEALCEAYNELDAYYYDHPVKVRLRNMMEKLDSLPTTAQDVISKVRNEAEDAKRYRWMRDNWTYAHGTIFFNGFMLGPYTTLDEAIDSALKTEVK